MSPYIKENMSPYITYYIKENMSPYIKENMSPYVTYYIKGNMSPYITDQSLSRLLQSYLQTQMSSFTLYLPHNSPLTLCCFNDVQLYNRYSKKGEQFKYKTHICNPVGDSQLTSYINDMKQGGP